MMFLVLIAVVVTSGSDSLALTLLAKQTFQKVIGITVDHRLALVLYYYIVEIFEFRG